MDVPAYTRIKKKRKQTKTWNQNNHHNVSLIFYVDSAILF